MARDRMAHPLKGDIRIEVRDAQGTIRILFEREKIGARQLAMVKALSDVIADPQYWSTPKSLLGAAPSRGNTSGCAIRRATASRATAARPPSIPPLTSRGLANG